MTTKHNWGSRSSTVELGDGHYWLNSNLSIDKPLRFIGDENNPSNVVIELGGTIVWTASGGFLEGITFRRPTLSSSVGHASPMLQLLNNGKVDMVHTVFDNDGRSGSVVQACGPGYKGYWRKSVFQAGTVGVEVTAMAHLDMEEVSKRQIYSNVLSLSVT